MAEEILSFESMAIRSARVQQLFFLDEKRPGFLELVDLHFEVFVPLFDLSQSLEGVKVNVHLESHLLLLVDLLVALCFRAYLILHLL